jgi:hypothetical protein
MRKRSVLLNGLILALINIVSVIAGFAVYSMLRPTHQIAFQVPLAAVLTVLAFLGWLIVGGAWLPRPLRLLTVRDLAFTFVAALLWSPIVFLPLHYTTQGYVSSFGNVAGLWLFQIVANAFALVAADRLLRRQSVETPS